MATYLPFPPSGRYISSVKELAHATRLGSSIQIHKDSIRRLLLSESFTSTFSRLKLAHGLSFPLKFPSVLVELNLISILSLMNFGSGYRVPLHEASQRGAYDTIRMLLFALYLSSSSPTSNTASNLLSAAGLRSLSLVDIASHLRLPLHVEKPHPSIPGVIVGEQGGPLLEFMTLLTKTLNETGEVLGEMGYPDLGSFVLESLKGAEAEGKKTGKGVDVDNLLERLVRAIPAFRDMTVVDGRPVYMFKKALFLIHAIHLRFSGTIPPPIPIPDTRDLPAFSDNVLPSMLVYLGVIDLSDAKSAELRNAFKDVEAKIQSLLQAPSKNVVETKDALKEGPRLVPTDSYCLRASAVDACEMIVLYARSGGFDFPSGLEWIKEITVPEVDGWLWSVAKDREDYRRLERFVERETVFF